MFLKETFILYLNLYYIGDWGLGIGDWAQSPIPNPQSPSTKKNFFYKIKFKFYLKINFINLNELIV